MQPGIHVLPVCCLVVGVLSYSRLARNILQPRELMLTGCVVNVWSPCLTLTCDLTLWPCGISCASGSTLYSYLWHISVVPCCNKVVSRGGCFQELSFFMELNLLLSLQSQRLHYTKLCLQLNVSVGRFSVFLIRLLTEELYKYVTQGRNASFEHP